MAQEAYGFNEQTMREVIRRLDDVDKTYDMIRRRLATFATRRHEAVYMPGAAEVIYAKYGWQPAAYGGTGSTGITGTAATTNGNIRPTTRQFFPKASSDWYILENGVLVAGSGSKGLVNVGSLPIADGFCPAIKIPGSDPIWSDLWMLLPDAPSHYASRMFTWATESAGGDWSFSDTDSRLIRAASGTITTNDNTRDWAFGWHSGDVMLSHFGWWEVTYGFKGHVSGSPYIELTTGAASAGTAHTHTYQLPGGFHVQFGVHVNFEPGTTDIDSPEDFIDADCYATPNGGITCEKTCWVETTDDPWHGQFHTRLSLACMVTEFSTDNPGTFVLDECWLFVKPASTSGNVGDGEGDGFGAGANQYPGGWNDGAGTFVWYGGGDVPIEIDKDGAEV